MATVEWTEKSDFRKPIRIEKKMLSPIRGNRKKNPETTQSGKEKIDWTENLDFQIFFRENNIVFAAYSYWNVYKICTVDPRREKRHPTGERAIEKFGRESGRVHSSPAPATERADIRLEILLPPHGRAHRAREIPQFLAGEMLPSVLRRSMACLVSKCLKLNIEYDWLLVASRNQPCPSSRWGVENFMKPRPARHPLSGRPV